MGMAKEMESDPGDDNLSRKSMTEHYMVCVQYPWTPFYQIQNTVDDDYIDKTFVHLDLVKVLVYAISVTDLTDCL